jgi:hypothetical protein
MYKGNTKSPLALNLCCDASNLLEAASSGTLPDPFVQRRDTGNGISCIDRDLWERCLGRSGQCGSRVDRAEGPGHLAVVRVTVRRGRRGFGRGVDSTFALDQRPEGQFVSRLLVIYG